MRPEALLAQFEAVPSCSLGAGPEPGWKRFGFAVVVMLSWLGRKVPITRVLGLGTDGRGKMKAWLFPRHCQRS